MIKLGKWIVGIVIAFGSPGFAQAEFYKYIDKNGDVQFTDNLANVPADQREQADEYEEVPPRPEVQKTDEDNEQGDTIDEGKGPEKALDEEMAPESVGTDLDKVGEQLRVEYEDLMKEKEAIEQTASQRLTQKLRKRIQEDIKDFNKRLEDFERRREAYNEAVEAHNAQIEKDAKALPGEPPAN
jgi:hypothetical protein